MRKQRYTPYFFDSKYEKRTYTHIGQDYGDRRTADRGCIRNFLRWYRKRIYNRKESKYKFCNTYEEWKLYLFEKKFCTTYDKQNMIKFLNEQKQINEIVYDSVKAVIIPLYIALYSLVLTLISNTIVEENKTLSFANKQNGSISIIIITLIVVPISIRLMYKYKKNIYFYQDYMDGLSDK